MTYQVLLLPRAIRDMDSYKGRLYSKLCAAIRGLSENPRPTGCKKLTGDEGYRIRIGDHRIIYRIDDKDEKVFIYRIRHRREVYR